MYSHVLSLGLNGLMHFPPPSLVCVKGLGITSVGVVCVGLYNFNHTVFWYATKINNNNHYVIKCASFGGRWFAH